MSKYYRIPRQKTEFEFRELSENNFKAFLLGIDDAGSVFPMPVRAYLRLEEPWTPKNSIGYLSMSDERSGYYPEFPEEAEDVRGTFVGKFPGFQASLSPTFLRENQLLRFMDIAALHGTALEMRLTCDCSELNGVREQGLRAALIERKEPLLVNGFEIILRRNLPFPWDQPFSGFK